MYRQRYEGQISVASTPIEARLFFRDLKQLLFRTASIDQRREIKLVNSIFFRGEISYGDEIFAKSVVAHFE